MKATDVELALLASARGWISPEIRERALAEVDRLEAVGLDKPLEEVLLEEGELTGKQVRALRRELGWTLTRPRIGDYEIVRRIGLGGMGAVFEAVHVRLKQRAALKVLREGLMRDPLVADRFRLEARTLARLNHPNLVHAMDSGRDGEYYYLAMEYIDGEDLRQVLVRRGSLDPYRALAIVRPVLSAICALEERRLVHRDVKPANVLLGRDGTVKLTDLGILQALDIEAPLRGRERFVCGTPHYVAPEQLTRGADLDSRADLYSLGATWYHAVTGRRPFQGRTSGEVLRAHLKTQPVPPSRLVAALPPFMEQTMLRWLARDRSARPPTALAALEELNRAVQEDTRPSRLSGARAPVSGRGPWHASRWRILLVAGAMVVLAGSVFLLALLLGGPGSRPASQRRPRTAFPPVARAPGVLARGGEAGERAPGPSRTRASGPSAPVPSVQTAPSVSKAPSLPLPGPPHTAGDGASIPKPQLPLPGEKHPAPTAAAGARGGETLRGAFLRVRREVSARWRKLLAELAELTGRWDGNLARARVLAREFHATRVGIEPGAIASPQVILHYEFAASRELDDFRAVPGVWEIRRGALCLAAGSPGGDLATIAWLVPPVTVEGGIAAPLPVAVGFGATWVAPAAGGDSIRIWHGAAEGGAAEGNVPEVPILSAGRFSVRFLADRVVVRVDGAETEVAVPAPREAASARGPVAARVLLHLGAGADRESVRWLDVTARLHPAWVDGRLQAGSRKR